MFKIYFGHPVTVVTPPAPVYYLPGTRDLRRVRAREELLSDAPGRQRAKVREPIKAEG